MTLRRKVVKSVVKAIITKKLKKTLTVTTKVLHSYRNTSYSHFRT